jgi:hypothetical protein
LVTWGSKATEVPTGIGSYSTVIAGETTYNATTNTATFRPDNLDQGSVYYVTAYGVTDGIQTSGGTYWRFSTGKSFQSYLVIPNVGRHGKMSPALGHLVTRGATTSFLVTPDEGYLLDSVSGCGGTLSGNTYTTGPITGVCEVVAVFSPKTVSVPASIVVPVANATGSYTIRWGTSTTPGVTYVLQEATNATFTANLRQVYSGTGTSAIITGRSSGVTYYYRVRAQRSGYSASNYRTAGNGCTVTLPCVAPTSLSVPVVNTTGSYSVNWSASMTPGVTYVLQEATNATFTANLRQAYSGTGISASISGRRSGVTYYYRVRAQRSGYSASNYRTAGNGCTVTLPCVAPAAITVPKSNSSGDYTVFWTASATAGVTYTLEESTDNFKSNCKAITTGLTTTSANIIGQFNGKTYWYRVKAIRANYRDSLWTTSEHGCVVSLMFGSPPE